MREENVEVVLLVSVDLLATTFDAHYHVLLNDPFYSTVRMEIVGLLAICVLTIIVKVRDPQVYVAACM